MGNILCRVTSARNTKDLLELVEQLTAKGVEFISLKEHIDTTTPTGKFMLTVFGAVALERGYLLQRQAEGIAAAKLRGKHLGRPAKKPLKGFGNLVKRWEHKEIPLQKVLDERRYLPRHVLQLARETTRRKGLK